MLLPLKLSQSITIDNYSTQFIALPVYEVENKLHNILPKVDKTSNWISVIGIFIAIALGVVSYLCVEEKHRPSLGLVVPLLLVVLVAFGFTIFLLVKSYRAITIKDIIKELTKDDYPTKVELSPKVKEETAVHTTTNSLGEQKLTIPVFKPKGKRPKQKVKKHKK